MDKLRFGTGGVPISAVSRSTLDGIARIAELGLDNMEVEFVHGVKMKEETATEVRELARSLDVRLSAHGPYYVNLASLEPPKIGASRSYVVGTAKACMWMGADRCTFHPAFYQKRESTEVYPIVREQLGKIQEELRNKNITGVSIRPELTGKGSQFGTLEELIGLAKEVENTSLCIDFAHAHARTGGANNSYNEFCDMLHAVQAGLGPEAIEDLYIHVSGIEYSEKGERNHLPFAEADLKWQELLQALKDFDARGLVVCESPILEEDALLLKRYWEEIV